ncbi:hypothetical protein [Streptomyces bacillaris]|uniref:hypothetical protein n=1 Tax=Streptomyces bacillaris TaxID=68179 RepID=UPI00382470D0
MIGPMVDTVRVLRKVEDQAADPDRYTGQRPRTWVADEAAHRGRLIYPSSREETTERDAQVEGHFLVLPPRVPVDGRCRVLVNEDPQPWELDGNPLPQRGRSPILRHLRVKLKRVEG